jgi:hypothetical protein
LKKGLAYSVVDAGLQLYHKVPESSAQNTLLNNVFFYVMYHLSSLQVQNMH